jgi:hypothetical protein
VLGEPDEHRMEAVDSIGSEKIDRHRDPIVMRVVNHILQEARLADPARRHNKDMHILIADQLPEFLRDLFTSEKVRSGNLVSNGSESRRRFLRTVIAILQHTLLHSRQPRPS